MLKLRHVASGEINRSRKSEGAFEMKMREMLKLACEVESCNVDVGRCSLPDSERKRSESVITGIASRDDERMDEG